MAATPPYDARPSLLIFPASVLGLPSMCLGKCPGATLISLDGETMTKSRTPATCATACHMSTKGTVCKTGGLSASKTDAMDVFTAFCAASGTPDMAKFTACGNGETVNTSAVGDSFGYPPRQRAQRRLRASTRFPHAEPSAYLARRECEQDCQPPFSLRSICVNKSKQGVDCLCHALYKHGPDASNIDPRRFIVRRAVSGPDNA
jgi:hypothetical protein